jgi:hypothetical protein
MKKLMIAAAMLLTTTAITTAGTFGPCTDARGVALDATACKAYYAEKASIVPMPDRSPFYMRLVSQKSGNAGQFSTSNTDN